MRINQLQTTNPRKPRENACYKVVFDFAFCSDWLGRVKPKQFQVMLITHVKNFSIIKLLGGAISFCSWKLATKGDCFLDWRSDQFPVESCFTALCNWSRKLAPTSQSIRCKTNTDGDLAICVFPRFYLFWLRFPVFWLAVVIIVSVSYDQIQKSSAMK